MDAQIKCNLCGVDTPAMTFLIHVPKCFRQCCLAANIVPLCTCNSCKAERTHPRNTMDGVTRKRRAGTQNQNEPSIKKSASYATEEIRQEKRPLYLQDQSYNKLCGKICIVCGSRTSSQTATLCIGKYRKIIICKKSHLTYDEEARNLCAAIEHEVSLIRTLGDLASVFRGTPNLDNLTEEPAPVIEDSAQCDGYSDLLNMKSCTTKPDGILFLTAEGITKRFCRPKHALCYLLEHYWSDSDSED